MFAFFRPAAHQAPLPEEKIDSTYRRLRWQIFAGIFIGYAGYYLLRKNFTLAFPDLIAQGYTKGTLKRSSTSTSTKRRGRISCTSGQAFPARCCAAGCRTRSSGATVA